MGIIVGKFVLPIPTHKAHEGDPANEEQQTWEADDRRADTAPVDLAKPEHK